MDYEEEGMEKPSYYAVLPAAVRYDGRLSSTQKLLYAEIAALTNSNGECTAGNADFSRLFGIHEVNISKSIKKLADCGYLHTRVEYFPQEQATKRCIYLALPLCILGDKHLSENAKTPHRFSENAKTPLSKNAKTPLSKNAKYNINNYNTSTSIITNTDTVSDNLNSGDLKNLKLLGAQKNQKFTKPTQKELEAFCADTGIRIDVQHFLDYYESNGWTVGRTRMKDWKATVRNWARRAAEWGGGKSAPQAFDTATAADAAEHAGNVYRF